MAKRKKFTVITVVESALLLVFVAAAIIVAANLRPVTLTTSDGAAVSGWRWGGKVYVDAAAFTTGMDAALDMDALTIAYTEPVDPEQIRAETTVAMTLQFDKDANAARQAHEDAVVELEDQIAGQAETIEDLQARIDELEGRTSSSQAGSSRGNGSGTTSNGNNSQTGTSTTSNAGGASSGTQTPDPTPAPTPPPAATAVDAGACIAAARSHALALGMTEDGSLGIGNSGYLNPPDISVLTQDNVIASLIYCLNQYASYAPDDHSLVHFNIVQSGNLIYALYQ